jgi:hypothetical protein
MQSLARRFSLSDRGLAKICAATNIGVPARGYGAKLQASKKVERWPLPPRKLGQSESVQSGRSAWGDDRKSDAEIINSPITPPPSSRRTWTPCARRLARSRKAPLPSGDSPSDWPDGTGTIRLSSARRDPRQVYATHRIIALTMMLITTKTRV